MVEPNQKVTSIRRCHCPAAAEPNCFYLVRQETTWELRNEFKARSHNPILSRIRFSVPKIGSRHSDGPISRFRFCDENLRRSFVVCLHDPIFRTNKDSLIWQNDHRDIMQKMSAPFIFQEQCQMKIERVIFSSVFFQNCGSVYRKVNVFTRSDFRNQQKSDP